MGNPCLGYSHAAHHPLSITPGGIPRAAPPAGKTAAANQLRHHPAAALSELLLEIPGRGEERFLLGVLSGLTLRGGGTEGGQSSAPIKSGLVLSIHSPASTAGSSTSNLCRGIGSKPCPGAGGFLQDAAEGSDAAGRPHLPAAPAAPLGRGLPAPRVGPGQVPAGSRQKGDPGAAGDAGSPRHPAPAGPGEHPESAAALPAESGGAGGEPEPGGGGGGGGGRGGSRAQAAPPDPHLAALAGHPRGTPGPSRPAGPPGTPGTPRSLPLPPPAVPHRGFPPAAPRGAGGAETPPAAAVPSRLPGATSGHHLRPAGGRGHPPGAAQAGIAAGFPQPGPDRSRPALAGRARALAAPAAGIQRRHLGRPGNAGAGGANPGEATSGGAESSGAGGGVRQERREVLPEVAEGLLPGHRLGRLGGGPQQLPHEVLRGLLPPQLQTGQHARPDPVQGALPVQGCPCSLLRPRRLRPHGADAPGQPGQAGVQPLRGHAGHQVPLCLTAPALPIPVGQSHPGSWQLQHPKIQVLGHRVTPTSPGSTQPSSVQHQHPKIQVLWHH